MNQLQQLVADCQELGLARAGKIIRYALAEQHRNTRHAAVEVLFETAAKADNPLLDAIVHDLSSEIMNLKQKSPLEQ